MHVSVHLFFYDLSPYQSVILFVCLYVCLSTHLSICLSIYHAHVCVIHGKQAKGRGRSGWDGERDQTGSARDKKSCKLNEWNITKENNKSKRHQKLYLVTEQMIHNDSNRYSTNTRTGIQPGDSDVSFSKHTFPITIISRRQVSQSPCRQQRGL